MTPDIRKTSRAKVFVSGLALLGAVSLSACGGSSSTSASSPTASSTTTTSSASGASAASAATSTTNSASNTSASNTSASNTAVPTTAQLQAIITKLKAAGTVSQPMSSSTLATINNTVAESKKMLVDASVNPAKCKAELQKATDTFPVSAPAAGGTSLASGMTVLLRGLDAATASEWITTTKSVNSACPSYTLDSTYTGSKTHQVYQTTPLSGVSADGVDNVYGFKAESKMSGTTITNSTVMGTVGNTWIQVTALNPSVTVDQLNKTLATVAAQVKAG